MRILACGHGHYDKGHCGQPDCANDFRRCPVCNPSEQDPVRVGRKTPDRYMRLQAEHGGDT